MEDSTVWKKQMFQPVLNVVLPSRIKVSIRFLKHFHASIKTIIMYPLHDITSCTLCCSLYNYIKTHTYNIACVK